MKTLLTMILMFSAIAVYAQVTDSRDGKTYSTVNINGQVWMSQNLNYSGTGYCYNNLESNCTLYGRLYTFDQTGSVCMEGWHVPSKTEVEALYSYLGGIDVAGAKMKKERSWEGNKDSPASTNTSGFSATYTGTRWNTGAYKYLTSSGLYWTSTEVPQYNSAYYFGVGYYLQNAKLGMFYVDQAAGVRCVKN